MALKLDDPSSTQKLMYLLTHLVLNGSLISPIVCFVSPLKSTNTIACLAILVSSTCISFNMQAYIMLTEEPLSIDILLIRQFAMLREMTKASWWGLRTRMVFLKLKETSNLCSTAHVFSAWPNMLWILCMLIFAAEYMSSISYNPPFMTLSVCTIRVSFHLVVVVYRLAYLCVLGTSWGDLVAADDPLRTLMSCSQGYCDWICCGMRTNLLCLSSSIRAKLPWPAYRVAEISKLLYELVCGDSKNVSWRLKTSLWAYSVGLVELMLGQRSAVA